MVNPKCFRCKTRDASFFPTFATYTAYKPHLQVARHTMDVAFCHECIQGLKAKDILTNNIWQQIVSQTHRDLNGKRDSTGQPQPAPKLDRERTLLIWTPFVRKSGPSILKPGGGQ